MGYQIVAVSPDNYQNLVSLEEKTEARYEIYSDENGELIKKIGIAFNSGGKRGILTGSHGNGIESGRDNSF